MSRKNYTVTIYYAHAGSPMSGGDKSGPGHMWYSIGDGTGPEKSYGFGPKISAPGWKGVLTTDDNSTYLEKHGKTREITKAQYEALEKFGEDPSSFGFSTGWYNAFTHSCVDFTWKAVNVIGLNPFDFEGYLSPYMNIGNIERIGDPNDPPMNFVRRWFHELWKQATNWTPPRRDPLALDLDGDGIETRGADGKVVFDHNNDGVKTGTGWLRPDDGWLVLDRNSNGTIDNGGELFGVDTVKADGTKASDGFDALSDLDSNDDGVFDAKDTRFADVRVWRDLNQDGISQSNELSTLAANNIRSISLNKTSTTTNLGNGNAQTATATFTRTDDTTGTAANLELVNNTFYRQFTNRVTLTNNARKLPEVSGSGRVRNLREAMSGSASLTTLVDTYAKQTTYASQRAQLDGLVRAWAGTADQNTSIQAATAKGFELIYMIPGQTRAHFARSRRWL